MPHNPANRPATGRQIQNAQLAQKVSPSRPPKKAFTGSEVARRA